MRWINKRDRKYRKKAHFLIVRFIRESWNKEEKHYVNFDYETFKRNRKFKALLFREQQGYCCYCMRKLDLNRGNLCTIEHILPHKIKDDNEARRAIAHYYSVIPRFQSYVRIVRNTNLPKPIMSGRPYPHFCAYENLVLSCSGAIYKTDAPQEEFLSSLHECCNNKRGSKYIVPLFFFPNIDLKYEKDGMLTFAPQYEETIKALNLEGNDNLCIIRRIWGNIHSLYTLNDVKRAAEDKELRSIILQDTDLNRNQAKRFMHSLYWNLVIEYQWFGEYFSSQTRR